MYKILVCDDEKDIVSALNIYLSSEGYEVIPAYSGKQWKEVKLVTLEELDEAPLTVDADGFAEFEITGKKILTIKFVG